MLMIITFQEAVRRLQAAGLRMTRPREMLLKLVLAAAEPFSVRAMHERAEREGLGIHLATVHRNLAEFVSVGLLDEMPGDENRLFALHTENESGAHVFCLDCRLTRPLAGMALDENESLQQALLAQGFDTSSVKLLLAAHCANKARHLDPDDCNKGEPA